MFAGKHNSNKAQNNMNQLPKSTINSLQQMLAWDQQFLAQKVKNNFQHKSNGGQQPPFLQSLNTKRPAQQSPQQSQVGQLSQNELRQINKKRKLQEMAREQDKLKLQKQQQTLEENNNQQLESSQDASDEYEVEKIVDKKQENGQVLYKVKWKGWDSSYNTWEPHDNLFRVNDMINEYEAQKTYQKRGEQNKQVDTSGSDLEQVGNQQQHKDKNNNQRNKDSVTSSHLNSSLQMRGESVSQSYMLLQQEQQLQKLQNSVVKGKSQLSGNNSLLLTKDYQDKNQSEQQSLNNSIVANKLGSKNNLQNGGLLENKIKPRANLDQSQSDFETLAEGQQNVQQFKPFSQTSNVQISTDFPKSQNPQMMSQKIPESIEIEDELEVNQSLPAKESNVVNKSGEGIEDIGDDDDKEYIFEAILDKRQEEGKEIEYLLKFSNHNQPEWELLSNLESIEQEIKEYENELKRKEAQAQQNANSISEQSQRDERMQIEEKQREKEVKSQTELPTSVTTIHSHTERTQQNKEHNQVKSNQQKQTQNSKHQHLPKQISIESDEQFENDALENNQFKSKIQEPTNILKSRPDSQKEQQKITHKPSSSLSAITKVKNKSLTKQSSNNAQTRTLSLDSNIQNHSQIVTQPMLNQLQQYQQLVGMQNCVPNFMFNQEYGCFYKGDQRYLIELCDKSSAQDLSKATFKITWKARQTGFVPLPSLVSYQMLKSHDPLGLVLFYESLHSIPSYALLK